MRPALALLAVAFLFALTPLARAASPLGPELVRQLGGGGDFR